ncbi:unnamed protein product [Clonostachys rhizophaga]|uniref:Uncharacterized protein n=1 Tax=Clonostachys rhizophaga TaxID=160324 RepID=A0A9N9YWS2_9HYPO|nr:unnamed protein product [Clonostachys rhizophaga]
MSDTITTSLLLNDFGPQTLVADVLGADATATTYLLNCPSGTDSNDCGVYNASVTIGPWASQTLPSGAKETGNYDFSMSMDTFQFSLHCEMSKTVAQKCTTVNIGGNNDNTPTLTISASELQDYGFTYVPVTITAGQDILSSATAKATASDTKASSSSSSADAKETGAAASRAVGILAALSVAVLTTSALVL